MNGNGLTQLWEEVLYGDDWSGPSRPGTPPLHQTSNFVFSTVAAMQEALKHEDKIPFYTRGANPTVSEVAQKIAALEGMEAGLLFGSGSAAIAAAVLSQVEKGDQILSVINPYSWTTKLIRDFCGKFGVDSVFCDPQKLQASITEQTKVIYLESPNSWTFETHDIARITQIARQKGIITILDNSYATPLLQQGAPLQVDLVAHSATKYLGGHSDVVAGVLCGSKQLIADVFNGPYMTLGAALSPFDAWLLLRSLRTLPLRLSAITETAKKIVDFLKDQEGIRKVYYPKPPILETTDHVPQTGLLSIDLNTSDLAAVERFCNGLKRFKLGPSWGSHESLAFPAIATMGSKNYNNPNVEISRVRLSVGLQSADYLIQDLAQALKLL